MASVYRIKGEGGVVIESHTFLELPNALQKNTAGVIRPGMIRYNDGWEAFEGAIKFTDDTVEYRRFPNLDENGRLLTSQLPESITSGLKYTGTYSPLTDDVDPPFTYAALPGPSTTSSGDYYIVRGIMDQAVVHYTLNPTTDPFVIFTPVNPLGTGDWMQIKYFIENGTVNAAFGRFNVDQIPTTGHEGLLSLVTNNTDLTNQFSTFDDPSLELGISDSDWVIITETDVQRIRQSRASILASSVIFDTNIMRELKRGFVTNSSNAQGIIDDLIIYGLRRTGDSMTSDGTEGAGRLGVTYGTAVAPAIAFNDALSDPEKDDGMFPDTWTDTKTGIFHPNMGEIGFTSNGVETVRTDSIGLKLIQTDTVNPDTIPAIRFVSPTNTVNPGISGLNDKITISVKAKNQVDFADGLTTFHGDTNIDNNLTVTEDSFFNGNTTIGDASTDTLTVNATSTFNADATFKTDVSIEGNTVIGDEDTDTLIVNAKTTFNAEVNIDGDLFVHGNTTLGDDDTHTLTVNATSTFVNDVKLNGDDTTIGDASTDILTVNSTSNFIGTLNTKGDTNIGDASTDTMTVNATSNFIGTVNTKGDTNIGDASTDTMTVTASSIFNSPTTFNDASNRFKNINLMPNGILEFENATTPSKITQISGDLQVSMADFADLTIMDGTTIRTRFNRYGVQLPVLNPVNDAVGVDGMIAFSTARNTVMQKANGKWTTVSAGGTPVPFTNTDWVLNGAYYTYTIPLASIQSILVQEASGANFSPVEVDSVVITPTNAVLSIPATPDLRFTGRAIVVVSY